MDPLQFACRPNVEVIYLLHWAPKHLKSAGSTVRVMLFNTSSAFHNIQLFYLAKKAVRE